MILGLEDDKIAVHYTCNGTAITATKKVQKMGNFLIISQEAWLTKHVMQGSIYYLEKQYSRKDVDCLQL